MSTLHEPRLQIDPRCIKCGKSPTADTPLLEMQNHLYICNDCRQDEERKGKRIAWADGITTPSIIRAPLSPRQPDVNNIPPNSIFALLEVSLEASQAEIETVLGEKMRFWMFEPDSEEKEQMIERLRTWQEELVNDPQFLEKQRASLEPSQPKGSALTIGDQQVYTAQEFVAACEASREGWQDGEHLLRKGELQHWILFQLANRSLAGEVHRLARARIPDFRLLNHILYHLSPERSFRFYVQESWEPLSQIPQAATLTELAQICDQQWERAEHHLYVGAMLLWLEQAQHCQGIREYYRAHIKGYEYDRYHRGLGLELLLERVMPQLKHPTLVVSFDGNINQFMVPSWDREIPHKPITLQIENKTRGFTSFTLEIVNSAPQSPPWLHLEGSGPMPVPLPAVPQPTHIPITTPPPGGASILYMLRRFSPRPATTMTFPPGGTPPSLPITLSGRTGAGIPAHKHINIINLETLERGQTYRQVLRLTERREYGRPPVIHEYPITLSTMTYLQGFGGILWRWGLRGGFPGFLWNFVAGSALATSVLLFLLSFAIPLHAFWQTQLQHGGLTSGMILGTSMMGTIDLLDQLHVCFVLIVGLITGSIGARAGFKQGHASYTEKQSARIFKKVALRLILPIFIVLLIWGSNNEPATSSGIPIPPWLIGGSLSITLFTMLIIYAITLIRSRVEQYLRLYRADLLNPPGKE
jgi:hypothetical protein